MNVRQLPSGLLGLHQAAATCFALMLAGLFALNTHPAVFQLGLAGFALAALGAGLWFRQPGNPQMTPALLGFGSLFLLHLLGGVAVAPSNWPAWRRSSPHCPPLCQQ